MPRRAESGDDFAELTAAGSWPATRIASSHATQKHADSARSSNPDGAKLLVS
jgi:hypothetical protein